MDKAFAFFAVAYGIVAFTRVSSVSNYLLAGATVVFGLLALLRRRILRRVIWRLRNRLIVAYLFIAVVPIVLIVTLVSEAGQFVIGQMAIYLANAELNRSINSLAIPAQMLARPAGPEGAGLRPRFRNPARTSEAGREELVRRMAPMIERSFPVFELAMTGDGELRFPANASIPAPPAGLRGDRGLMVRREGKEQRLYAWAHAAGDGAEVTIAAPVDHGVLSKLAPDLGDIDVVPYTERGPRSRLPAKANPLDFEVTGVLPLEIPAWDSGRPERNTILLVNSRVSAVLGVVFGKGMNFGEAVLTFFAAVSILFLLVEMASLWAGIRLTRTMTGAVHELYEGTEHVKDGDFSYRIPVRGDDQLAELSASFNTMTANLGRLIVVAKEKERLESELAIAREVQNQLFPKDVPFTKTLELKGVCNPARMVSGDYYDFMALSDTALAFAIGDVAGKGISAALLMATIQSTMRTQLSAVNGTHEWSAAQLVGTLNRQLYATTAPEKYATFFFAIYDETTHGLRYTNAGHLAPMLLRDGSIETLDSTGTVVGAFPFARYDEKTVTLEHGDILVAYTDGIVEPENAYGEMFGEERLRDLLLRYAKADSSEMIARVMEAVVEWTGSSELQDDMTMVVARRV
jgi:phosphoserine phosphatase RsbU/P